MAKYIIEGGKRLCGEVVISGAKNAAVAILPAAMLVDGVCTIENVPQITDVKLALDMMADIGVKVEYISPNCVRLDSRNVKSHIVNEDMARKMRASYYFIGALLGRRGKANVSLPGGCNFGTRPIDQHVKGFNALGASVEIEAGIVIANSKERLRGTSISLDVVSVGATMNVMIASVLAEGVTVITNAAKEPHIVDLANFLITMGANITGAGTDTIKITGVDKLNGGTYAIIPDQIEAGTYMAAAVATGGEITVKNVITKHLECITARLVEMGATVEEYEDALTIKSEGKLRAINVKTLPYPGFPTDMQAQIATLLSVAEGKSTIIESVWENRFQYVEDLMRMGANIKVQGNSAVIEGVDHLVGKKVRACDLRAGAAFVVAALGAEGISEIDNIVLIERGYECLVEKLRAVGANITKVED
ncbi:MAG: UDP-N-acetylglucosamine 1-carboxyvinyltransferase [Clostridia bacterium]|nr:UDP-N-acetylglucosamine 1-carboxyvinyltransferase [Clostridia bacterium]